MGVMPYPVKVGVLAGGVSSERAISLLSAAQVFEALRRHHIEAQLIDITTRDKEALTAQILSHSIDIAFIALHGEFGEDGGIQSILEELGIVYTGSDPAGSYNAMDKIISKEMFVAAGVPTAPFRVYRKGDPIPTALAYPLVVKPYYAGSSLGVSIVRESSQIEAALKKAHSLQDILLLEQYIEGREFTVGILEDMPLAVVEIIPKLEYFDFQTKYTDGSVDFVAPAEINPNLYESLQQIALHAHRTLGCRHFSRIDIRVDNDNTPFVLEVNSIPGLTSHSLLPLSARCCGISFDGLIVKMLLLAYHEKKLIQKV